MSADLHKPPFFDTNILIYAFLGKDWRRPIASQLLYRGGLVSVQVLNEAVSVSRKQLKIPWNELLRVLQLTHTICGPAVVTTQATHQLAVQVAQRYGFHVYDACIIASALEADCTTLYSEDMQDGQQVGSLTIRNPFTAPA